MRKVLFVLLLLPIIAYGKDTFIFVSSQSKIISRDYYGNKDDTGWHDDKSLIIVDLESWEFIIISKNIPYTNVNITDLSSGKKLVWRDGVERDCVLLTLNNGKSHVEIHMSQRSDIVTIIVHVGQESLVYYAEKYAEDE